MADNSALVPIPISNPGQRHDFWRGWAVCVARRRASLGALFQNSEFTKQFARVRVLLIINSAQINIHGLVDNSHVIRVKVTVFVAAGLINLKD